MSPGRGHLLHGSYEADGPSEGVQVKLSSGSGKARRRPNMACRSPGAVPQRRGPWAHAQPAALRRTPPGSLALRPGQQVWQPVTRWWKRRRIAFASPAQRRKARWCRGWEG